MVGREDIGSWLSGPAPGTSSGAAAGTRLGLPAAGPGALAPIGRRVAALVIDWFACQAIALVLLPGDVLAPVWIFAVENVLLVGTIGTTLGHRLLGLRVRRVATPSLLAVATQDGPDVPRTDPGPDVPPNPLLAAVRTALLCLVIPAVVWDADGRGLHDRLAGTVIVRR